MRDADPDAEDADAPQELDWQGVKKRERQKRQATKRFVLEYSDGSTAIFEYGMVENISAIARKYTRRKPTRSGQEPEFEMDEDDEWAFGAELIQEAVVSAPDGFKATEREIREGFTKPVLDDFVDAITNFSQIDEETYIKFR